MVWVDHYAHSGSAWYAAGELAEVGELECFSVGWVVAKTTKAIKVAGHIGPEKGNTHYSGVMTIATRAIVSWEPLPRPTVGDLEGGG